MEPSVTGDKLDSLLGHDAVIVLDLNGEWFGFFERLDGGGEVGEFAELFFEL